MTESHALPSIAATAKQLLDANYQRALNDLAQQTVDSLGLTGLGWNVDFNTRLVSRSVPDISPTPETLARESAG